MLFVVQSGLTRRLVEAPTERDAINEFMNDAILRRYVHAEFDVREASDADIADFGARRNRPTYDGQTTLELEGA
jgi:hypothetical protein